MARQLRSRMVPDRTTYTPPQPLIPLDFPNHPQVHLDRPAQDAFFSIPELCSMVASKLYQQGDKVTMTRVCRSWRSIWMPLCYAILDIYQERKERQLPILGLFAAYAQQIVFKAENTLNARDTAYVLQIQPWPKLHTLDLYWCSEPAIKAFARSAHLFPRLRKLRIAVTPRNCGGNSGRAHDWHAGRRRGGKTGRDTLSVLSAIQAYLLELEELDIAELTDSHQALFSTLHALKFLRALSIESCEQVTQPEKEEVQWGNEHGDDNRSENMAFPSVTTMTLASSVLLSDIRGLDVHKAVLGFLHRFPNVDRIQWMDNSLAPPDVSERFWEAMCKGLPKIHTLVLEGTSHQDLHLLSNFASALEQHCPRLRRLAIRPPILGTQSFSGPFPTRLEQLRVVDHVDLTNAALSSLIPISAPTSIAAAPPSLMSPNNPLPTLVMTQAASGATLTLLDLASRTCLQPALALALQQSCSRLRHLRIYQSAHGGMAYDCKLWDKTKPWACGETLQTLDVNIRTTRMRRLPAAAIAVVAGALDQGAGDGGDAEDESKMVVPWPYTLEEIEAIRSQLHQLKKLHLLRLMGEMMDLRVISQSDFTVYAAPLATKGDEEAKKEEEGEEAVARKYRSSSGGVVVPSILERIKAGCMEVTVMRERLLPEGGQRSAESNAMTDKEGCELIEQWQAHHPQLKDRITIYRQKYNRQFPRFSISFRRYPFGCRRVPEDWMLVYRRGGGS